MKKLQMVAGVTALAVMSLLSGCQGKTSSETTDCYYALARKDTYFGYIDATGETVIDFRYEDAGNFSNEGLAAVCVDGAYGYINAEGKMVITPEFEQAYAFSNGYAVVQSGGRCGVIDTEGKMIIPTEYDGIFAFGEDGKAIYVDQGKFGYLSKDGEVVTEAVYDSPAQLQESVPSEIETTDENVPSENQLYAVYEDEKWGYKNTDGEMVIEPTYEFAEEFSEAGIAIVYSDGAYGCIDTSGEWVIEPEYEDIGVFVKIK